MKTILTLSLTILIIFSSGLNYSQELGWGAGEIYVGTYQQAGEQMISYRYRMTSVGPIWGGGPHANPPTSFILNPSNPNYQTAIATFEGEQFFTNTNFSGYDWPHFRIIRPDDININAFGYGLYKFSVDGGSANFFIDYRDDNYGRNIYSNCPGNDCNDIWIKYESDPVDKFYYVRHDPDSEPGIDPEHSAWIAISNGQLLYYYKIKLQQSPSTDEFPDYWDNCLVVTPDANNHPRLVFGPYPYTLQGTITGYKLYRSASHVPGQQPSNFTLLVTLESDEYYYVDDTITIGSDYNTKSYYVKCVYEDPWESTGETDPTNTVEVRLEIPQKISIPKSTHKNRINYQLEQNYPNPFNPSTRIDFSLEENGITSLIVYDLLGRKVATLINEQKQTGTYSVEFDASSLPSGIYFYTVTSGNFTATKKLILLK